MRCGCWTPRLLHCWQYPLFLGPFILSGLSSQMWLGSFFALPPAPDTWTCFGIPWGGITVFGWVPHGCNLWMRCGQWCFRRCLHSHTIWAFMATCISWIDSSLPFMPVRTLPPNFLFGVWWEVRRCEQRISLWVPFFRQFGVQVLQWLGGKWGWKVIKISSVKIIIYELRFN